MALTYDVQRPYSTDAHLVKLYSNTADTIYEGAILTYKADGTVKVSTTANEKYAGIADEQVVVPGTGARIRTAIGGLVTFPFSGADESDMGTLKVSDADDAVADYASGKTVVGRVVDINKDGGTVTINTEDQRV